jgi:integrase
MPTAATYHQFGAFLADRGRDALAVEHAELAVFVDELANSRSGTTPLAPATLQRKIACLRSFYRHLQRSGMIERNPASELSSPRLTTRRPQSLSHEDIQQLLAQPRGTSPAALRDRALLELLYACGIRLAEVIALQPDDLDLETVMLCADANGPKERLCGRLDTARRRTDAPNEFPTGGVEPLAGTSRSALRSDTATANGYSACYQTSPAGTLSAPMMLAAHLFARTPAGGAADEATFEDAPAGALLDGETALMAARPAHALKGR